MESLNKKRILLHAWSLQKKEDTYYIPFTHWVYLNEIVNYYDEIILLSPIKKITKSQEIKGRSISCFDNVKIYSLPYTAGGYISSLKYFFNYQKAYKNIKGVTTYYARYPVPFGWLQKIYGKKNRRIIHYVGDPIDVAENNPNFSRLKKTILVNGFKVENSFYNWACKGAEVYTNGHHIAEKLIKKKIKATPLISSTLTESDFYIEEKNIDINNINFIYLGYLRKAKGVETILRAFSIIQKQLPNIKLTIIGTGEFELNLKLICKEENIRDVFFLGHIDDRIKINSLLRQHDIFLFGSLSEGSPRVILEAIANGLLVISTPVGSLPKTFENGKEILYAEFNNEKDFSKKFFSLAENISNYNLIRNNAFKKAKNYTIENFIKKIFYED